MEWILTGNEIDAQQLERFGLVNRILPAADFENALQAFVAELTSKSKPVLALAKRAQLEAYYSTFTEAMSRGQSLYLHELMELEDARSGPVAHVAGRPYQVQNR
jgi:enoyl-CoA hydratase